MYIFYKLPFQYFLGLGCHIGSRFHLWSVESSPNVLFKMLEYPVINLTSTSLNFIAAVQFIKFCTSRNLRPLFFLSRGTELYLEKKDKVWKFSYYLVQYWLPGLLSNFKFIFNKDKFKAIPSEFLYIRKYPDFLIFLGITDRTQHLASADSRISRMPSIGLNDVDAGPSMFNYSIFSNSKSFVMAFHFYKLFARAVIDGANFFTTSVADKVFKFYQFYLINIFRTEEQRAEIFDKSRFYYPLTPSFKVVNYYKFFNNFAIPTPHLFLAKFSYSVLLTKSFKNEESFGKLSYSKAFAKFKPVSIPFQAFYMFKRLLPFYRRILLSSKYNFRKKLMFFINYKLKKRRPRIKRLMLPRSLFQKKRKLIKFNKFGKYTARFLRSKLKDPKIFYNGLNILSFL